MFKTFTFSSGHFFPQNIKTSRKVEDSVKAGIRPQLKPLPSDFSLSLIMGYAAALNVVKMNEDLQFRLIAN
jgi:hypothetical protein